MHRKGVLLYCAKTGGPCHVKKYLKQHNVGLNQCDWDLEVECIILSASQRGNSELVEWIRERVAHSNEASL